MKKFVLLILTVVMSLTLFSCGKKKAKAKKDTRSAAEKKYEVKLSPPEYADDAFDLEDIEVDDFGFKASDFEYIE
ncbi:hypothetical protein [Treponema sp.]|uniref:hypothetical protein n=1 Tax=Treponema sp. TaxID=166 RepID=UPI0025FFC2CC|nr:hypothetical protein [Treponema sp.]MCR5218485.1 hypothetical protein [Treponema sp.]